MRYSLSQSIITIGFICCVACLITAARAASLPNGGFARAYFQDDSMRPGSNVTILGVSWRVDGPGEFVDGPWPKEITIGPFPSDPEERDIALRKLEAQRKWPWQYFGAGLGQVVVLSREVVSDKGEIRESSPVGILPSYHPGDDFARGGTYVRFVDYGRLPAWVDKQLLRIDDQHFVLLERNTRAFLMRPLPEDSEFKMKKEGMLLYECLPDNPFLTKLPKGDYTLVSAAVLGKQVFVSTKGGWVASIDSEKDTWSDASQPFEEANVYLVSDGNLLHALVFKNEKDEYTLRHYTSDDGKDWKEKEKLPSLVSLPTRFLLSGDDLYAVYEKSEDIVIESPKDAEGKTTKTTYPGIKYTSVSVSRLTAEKTWEEVVSRNLTDTRKFPMDYGLQKTDKGTSLMILWAKSTEIPPKLEIEYIGEDGRTIDISDKSESPTTPATEGETPPPTEETALGEPAPPIQDETPQGPENSTPLSGSELHITTGFPWYIPGIIVLVLGTAAAFVVIRMRKK